MTKGFSLSIWLLVLAVLITGATPAEAAGKRRVGVSLTGMPAGPIREAVSDVLKKHGFDPVAPDLSGESEDAIASAAKQGKLVAVIVGEVREGGKRTKLRVYGASGDLIGEGSWSEKGGAKKLAKDVERTLWARVGGALSKAHAASGGGGERAEKAEKAEKAAPPPAQQEEAAEEKSSAKRPEEQPTYSRSKESEEKPATEESEAPHKKKGKKKPEKEEEAESGPPSPPAGPALDVWLGGRFVSRSLTWNQVQDVAVNPGKLSPYSVNLAPAVGVALAWFPAAHFTGGLASNLGLALSVEYIPGLVSQTSDGKKYPTQSSDFGGGARGRLGLGPVEAALTLGGGQHAMIFRSGDINSPRSGLTGTPDVKYTYARAAIDLRIGLPAKLALMLGGAYRYIISAGDQNYLLQTNMFLPKATVMGFDAGAAVGYRFLPALEARGGFDLRRYQITAGANTHMVTSGVDQYIALWVGLAVVLDGAGKATGDDEEGESAPKESAKPSKKKAEKPPEEEESEE